MTEPSETEDPQGQSPQDETATRRPGERLAKAIARAGLGSRRDAEQWIVEGRVKVNGETVSAPAFNVTSKDQVEVDGRPMPARERTRLWLYHKPRGYVTTNHDPEGRETVFSILPAELPRVMTVGRLDINTEGLLLLTNDGGLARVLELPETGWLRRYRVRAFGKVEQDALDALKQGVEIDGFAYGAIEAEVERRQKDNVWLRFSLREGKNREVKRVAEHLGLAVNRLIRISFGPFQLGALEEGAVEEVRTRTLVEQLGRRLSEEAGCDFEAPAVERAEEPRKTGGRGAGRDKAPAAGPDRSRMADPSQRAGRRAPIVRPRDMAPPSAGAAPDADAPVRTKRAAPVADRRGRQVKVERVSRTALEVEAAPKRYRKRDEGAAERFGAAGRTPRDKDARPDRASRPRSPARSTPENEALLSWDAPSNRTRPSSARSGRPEGGDAARPRPASAGRPGAGGRPERPTRAEGAEPPRGPEGRRPGPRWRDGAERGEERKPYGDRPDSRAQPARTRPGNADDRAGGRGGRVQRPASDARRDGPRPPRGEGSGDAPRRPSGERPTGDARPRGRPSDDRPRASERWPGGRPAGGRPGGGDRAGGGQSRGPGGPRPSGPRSDSERPGGQRPGGPGGPRARGPGGAPAGKGPGGKGFGGKGFAGKGPGGKGPGGRGPAGKGPGGGGGPRGRGPGGRGPGGPRS